MFALRMVFALRIALAAGLVAALAAPTCFAQAMATRDTLPPPKSAATGPVRKLAPGIVTEIPADARPAEKVSRHDIVEILASDPTYGIPPNSPAPSRAKGVRFEHDVQTLAFGFKPLRMIRADVPNDAGRLQAKLVWYLVFHVKNPSEKPMRFSPVFTLEDLDSHILYPDELLPVVIPAIQKREDPNRPLLNDVAIAGELCPAKTVGASSLGTTCRRHSKSSRSTSKASAPPTNGKTRKARISLASPPVRAAKSPRRRCS